MKNFLFFIPLLLLAQIHCSTVNEVESDFKTIGYETSQGEFKLQRTPSELKEVMQKVVAKINPRATKFGDITDVYVKKVTTEDGNYKYFLFANEKNTASKSTIAIALSLTAKGSVEFQDGKTCVHRCISGGENSCGGNCDMNILEECKRVMCTCSGGRSGCESEIVITYTE
jgi:hypothetical protein